VAWATRSLDRQSKEGLAGWVGPEKIIKQPQPSITNIQPKVANAIPCKMKSTKVQTLGAAE